MNRDQERYENYNNGNAGSSQVTRALPGILRQVKENSLSILVNQLNEFFNSCDDLFFELANHASSNNEQNLYFDSMREIRLKKKDVVSCFKDNFNAHFAELVRPNRSQVSAGDELAHATMDNLGLVEDDKMEQDVAISSVISKTRQDCQENIYHLALRFDYLLPDLKVTEANNPLDPKQICEAFTQAATRLELDLKARIILFKQFDRMVARHLNKIYSLANELLINAGVLPKVVPSVVKKSTAPGPVATNEASKDGPDAQDGAEQAAFGGTTASNYSFEQLSNLLSGLRAAAGSDPDIAAVSTSGGNYGQPISQDTLVSQLTDIQKQFAEAKTPRTKEELKATIYHILQASGEDGRPSSLSQSDEDVINLVSMFFEFILDDRNLPVPIQALVSRLQIPVLKIALKDKKFFNNSKHIARVLINEIAALSIGWNESQKEQQDALFELINSVVHNINDEFVGDFAVFQRELDRLLDFKAKESKRAKIVETRTNQAAEGKAKTDHTKKLVQTILLQRLNKQEMPKEIADFLINHWQKLLVLVRLKAGDSSPEWLSNLQVVDDLIWVVQDHSDEKSLKRVQRIRPKLLSEIKNGLATTGTAKEDIAKLVGMIENTLEEINQSGGTPDLVREKLKPEQLAALGQAPEGLNKSWKEMSALERQQVKQKASYFEFIKKAETLKVGSWFTLQDEKSNKVTRCKLASYIEPNERFVFVNRFGQKTSEKSKQEVATELQKQLLKPLDVGLLFDRAMSTIVDNLKRVNKSNTSTG